MTLVANRYSLDRVLGRGGMGEVHLATNVSVGNRVAVKFLLPPPGGAEGYRERFLAEARIGVTLTHPGIAQVLDAGEEADGRLFIVFEFVEGEDLRKLIARETLSWPRARDIVIRLGEALAYAHSRGVVHRDVKPENVRVRSDLVGVHVKVLDFGIARLDGDARLTAEGSFSGTPAYLAPEQAEGLEVDGRADLYCLGLLLFELVTGRAVVTEKNPTAALMSQLMKPVPLVAEVCPERAWPALDDVLAKACAKRREERFPDVATFLRAVLALPAPAWGETSGTGSSPRSEAPTLSHRGAAVAPTLPQRQTPALEATAPVAHELPTRPSVSAFSSRDGALATPAPAAVASSSRGTRRPALVVGSLVLLSAVTLAAWRATSGDATPRQVVVDAHPTANTGPLDERPTGNTGALDSRGNTGVLDALPTGNNGAVEARPTGNSGAVDSHPIGNTGSLEARPTGITDAGASHPRTPPRPALVAKDAERPPVPREPVVPATGGSVPSTCPQLAQFTPELTRLDREELVRRYRASPYLAPSAVRRTLSMLEQMSESAAPETRDCQYRAQVIGQIIAAKTLPTYDPYAWSHLRTVAQLQTLFLEGALRTERTREQRLQVLEQVKQGVVPAEPEDAEYLHQWLLGELLSCELTDVPLASLGARRPASCRTWQ